MAWLWVFFAMKLIFPAIYCFILFFFSPIWKKSLKKLAFTTWGRHTNKCGNWSRSTGTIQRGIRRKILGSSLVPCLRCTQTLYKLLMERIGHVRQPRNFIFEHVNRARPFFILQRETFEGHRGQDQGQQAMASVWFQPWSDRWLHGERIVSKITWARAWILWSGSFPGHDCFLYKKLFPLICRMDRDNVKVIWLISSWPYPSKYYMNFKTQMLWLG